MMLGCGRLSHFKSGADHGQNSPMKYEVNYNQGGHDHTQFVGEKGGQGDNLDSAVSSIRDSGGKNISARGYTD